MITEPCQLPPCSFVDTGESLKGQPEVLAALKRLGYQGILRYVPFAGLVDKSQITAGELEEILEAGFASMPIMRVRWPGWKPRDVSGELDARAACLAAGYAGYAPGTHLWIDAEGMSEDTTALEAHRYNADASRVFVAEGYRAGLYDGFSEPESAAMLYALPDVTSYGCDVAHRVPPAPRGFAWKQRPQFSLLGFTFDGDDLVVDGKGETPWWTRLKAGIV